MTDMICDRLPPGRDPSDFFGGRDPREVAREDAKEVIGKYADQIRRALRGNGREIADDLATD